MTEHEWKVLELLAGKREGEWGACVGACLEFLQGRGYCTPGPTYTITPAGRAVLDAKPTSTPEAQ